MTVEFPQPITDLEAHRFSGRGIIYSFTIVYEAPTRFKEFVPYVLALVKLEEGPIVTAQLTDLDFKWVDSIKKFDVEIGMPVEMVTRKLFSEGDKGLIIYGYKFRPFLPSQSTISELASDK